ncbi:MAG: cytochrome c [Flavobacteriaceae bacterium]|nr:cytochrome c [Flavobacteriaceae bacterium]
MKITMRVGLLVMASLLFACGGKEQKKKGGFSYEKKAKKEVPQEAKPKVEAISTKADFSSKGIGPVKDLKLPDAIDKDLAAKGEETYKKLCAACHKAEQKFIGPAPKGILERRTPEWVMNMIMNPEVMIKEDPIGKKLLAEFNNIPMTNQNVSEEDARAVLEYFRTL